jgi:ABC-type glycerol-3-phosphate transport system substrate-binding protein
VNRASKFAAVTVAVGLSALVSGFAANAAEITVVSSGGPLPDVLGTLMPMFEKATGNKVKISFKGQPAVAADVKQGAADLVITNTEVVDELGGDRVLLDFIQLDSVLGRDFADQLGDLGPQGRTRDAAGDRRVDP